MLKQPLVTKDGETFLDEQQVFRFIREKCGDEIAEWVEDTHIDGANIKGANRAISFAKCVIHSVLDDIASWDLDAAADALEDVRIE